jgi:hypothetical protein
VLSDDFCFFSSRKRRNKIIFSLSFPIAFNRNPFLIGCDNHVQLLGPVHAERKIELDVRRPARPSDERHAAWNTLSVIQRLFKYDK